MRQLVVAVFFADGPDGPDELAKEIHAVLRPFKAEGTKGEITTYRAAHKQTPALLEALADLGIDVEEGGPGAD